MTKRQNDKIKELSFCRFVILKVECSFLPYFEETAGRKVAGSAVSFMNVGVNPGAGVYDKIPK